MPEQLRLDVGLITVHCFTCPHTVQSATPDGAHDEMERHYGTKHRLLIDRLVGRVASPSTDAGRTHATRSTR